MDMPKRLYIDPKECKACGACEEICPEVFRVDENLGYAQILDLETYPEDKINEAIVACPGRCIDWNESKDAENPPVSPFSKGGSNKIPPLVKGQTKTPLLLNGQAKIPPLTKGGEGGFSGDNEYFCQKYQEPIKTKPPACPHPLDYCQFRSSCPVHFLEKERS
ncbi:MAG: ferredoxin [Thermodesulfobacteriota bacterium]|nr:ferredoxin [Thermodesulfobacteriota bacterium]